MAGIGNYKKGEAFSLKSGNKISFKEMGSSPAKQKVDPDAPGTPGQPGYEPPVIYEELDEEGKKLWHKVRAKKNRPEPGTSPEKRIEKELDREVKKKKSPAKQDRPVEVFEKKGDRIKEPKKPKARKTYQQRKEELLNQGFTQEDADQMIKSGAVTGRVDPKSKKK